MPKPARRAVAAALPDAADVDQRAGVLAGAVDAVQRRRGRRLVDRGRRQDRHRRRSRRPARASSWSSRSRCSPYWSAGSVVSVLVELENVDRRVGARARAARRLRRRSAVKSAGSVERDRAALRHVGPVVDDDRERRSSRPCDRRQRRRAAEAARRRSGVRRASCRTRPTCRSAGSDPRPGRRPARRCPCSRSWCPPCSARRSCNRVDRGVGGRRDRERHGRSSAVADRGDRLDAASTVQPAGTVSATVPGRQRARRRPGCSVAGKGAPGALKNARTSGTRACPAGSPPGSCFVAP